MVFAVSCNIKLNQILNGSIALLTSYFYRAIAQVRGENKCDDYFWKIKDTSVHLPVLVALSLSLFFLSMEID